MFRKGQMDASCGIEPGDSRFSPVCGGRAGPSFLCVCVRAWHCGGGGARTRARLQSAHSSRQRLCLAGAVDGVAMIRTVASLKGGMDGGRGVAFLDLIRE